MKNRKKLIIVAAFYLLAFGSAIITGQWRIIAPILFFIWASNVENKFFGKNNSDE